MNSFVLTFFILDKSTAPPSWLNISMDAALGFRANVFQVHRVQSSGGKKSGSGGSSTSTASSIAIHPGASSVVCRHTLEVLISLAKSFSAYFLPWKESQNSNVDSDKKKSASVKCTAVPSGE